MNIIYGLVDPRSKQLRYVGMSRRGLKRAREHLKPWALTKNTHKNNWIKQLLHAHLKPEIVVLQKLPDTIILGQAEIFWISYFRSLGFPLTNQCKGGEGFTGVHSKETRHRMIEAQRLRHSKRPELKEISRQTGYGNRGRTRSIETRVKISTTLKVRGIRPPSWAIEKNRQSQLGKPLPESVRLKISQAKCLPEALELRVVDLRRQGQSIKQIATLLGRSHGGIHLILKRRKAL